MNDSLRQFVRHRANYSCEYCGIPQSYTTSNHQIDHIVAEQHHGPTTTNNLAFSCLFCNKHKGTNLSGIDPVTRKHVRLFHPRRHKWSAHFSWDGCYLVGKTAIGRATVNVLAINLPHRVTVRESLQIEGLFPW